MKQIIRIFTILLVTGLIFQGCSSSKDTQTGNTPTSEITNTDDPGSSSADKTGPGSNDGDGIITVGTDAETISEAIDKAQEGHIERCKSQSLISCNKWKKQCLEQLLEKRYQ